MNSIDKEALINDLAKEATNDASLKALIQFFYDKQIEYLESLSDEDLRQHIIDYSSSISIEDYLEKE